MHKRKLGHTDIELSEIGLGTWGLGGAYGRVDEAVARATLDTALEAGVTTLDVSPLWGEGAVERWVGEAIEGARDQAQLVLRSGAVVLGDRVAHRFDPASLREDLEGSMERLKTDRVDVWLLHEPGAGALELPGGDDAPAEGEDLFSFCQSLVEEGVVGAWGISSSHPDNVRLALRHGAKAICMPFNLLQRDDVHDLEADLVAAGAGVLARSPLLHGLLAARWTEYRQFARDDHRRARWTQEALRVRLRHVGALRYLVHDDVPNMATAAVRFVLNSRVVTTCLLGARRPLQIRDAEAMAGEPPYLDEEDLLRLGQVLKAVGA